MKGRYGSLWPFPFDFPALVQDRLCLSWNPAQRSVLHVTSVRSDERMDGISAQFRLMIRTTNSRQTNAQYGCGILGSQRVMAQSNSPSLLTT